MDQNARDICERAFAALDRADAMQAEPKPVLSFDEEYRREAEAADQYLADLKRRRLEQEPLVYRMAKTPPEPKASAMTDAADRAWVMRSVTRSLS